jgi:hypothetical protein
MSSQDEKNPGVLEIPGFKWYRDLNNINLFHQ